MEVGLTAISMLVTLNWAAGLGAVAVGVGAGVEVETDVGVAPVVGVGVLLLPPPQAVTANNNSRQGNKAAFIECLVRLKFFNIAFSLRRVCIFLQLFRTSRRLRRLTPVGSGCELCKPQACKARTHSLPLANCRRQ